MQQKVISYQLAESIDLKGFCKAFAADLHYSDPSELFYRLDSEQYVYVFKYGAVCFLNMAQASIESFIQQLGPFCRNRFTTPFTDEFIIEPGSRDVKVGFNKVEVPTTNIDMLRLVMLNVAQSVALDYYEDQGSQLLANTNYHTQVLENKGRLDVSGVKLKKYIGKTLLLRNRIAENIYVFDSPPETWEDETLNKIDAELKRTFDLHVRVRTLHESLNIIRDNLELFQGLLQHRHSSLLEWIVIILIFIEILHMVFEEVF